MNPVPDPIAGGGAPARLVDAEAALAAAGENARRNEVRLTLQHSRDPLDARFDRVVANILTNPLRVLAPLLSGRVRPGGAIALSGGPLSEASLRLELAAHLFILAPILTPGVAQGEEKPLGRFEVFLLLVGHNLQDGVSMTTNQAFVFLLAGGFPRDSARAFGCYCNSRWRPIF